MTRQTQMKTRRKRPPKRESSPHYEREAKVRNWVLLWALGIPIPVLILIFLLRGCT